MAWMSTDARDVPPSNPKLICHSKRECRTVICLLCDGGYCRSDFNIKVAEGKGFYITSNLIVCPAHAHITYNLMVAAQTNDSSEVLPLNRKSLLLSKYIESKKNGTAQDIDMDDEVLSVVSDTDSISSTNKRRRVEEHDLKQPDECVNCQSVCNENLYLKEMNTELREHNKELRDHNNYLRKIDQKREQSFPPVSYSEIVSCSTKKPQETVQIIVKPKTDVAKGNILQLVQNEISKNKKAKILNIKKMKNENVIIKCINKQNSEEITSILESDMLTVSPVDKRNPQIKIIDVKTELDMERLKMDNTLIDDIIGRNGLEANDFKIVHLFKQRNNKKSIIAEVTPNAYMKIMKFKSIFIGYENCRVFDDFNDRICKKCCGYGHSLRKCPRKEEKVNICSKCAIAHEGSTCTATIPTCINCVNANKYLKKKREEHHGAKDKQCCETYKARWERYISITNYPWKPEAPFKNITIGKKT